MAGAVDVAEEATAMIMMKHDRGVLHDGILEGWRTFGNIMKYITGWFVESLATQVPVIFFIRTRLNPLRSRPHPWLVATSLIVVAIAALLPFTLLGRLLGFVPPPLSLCAVLAAMVAGYLVCVEWAKRWFYRGLAAPAHVALPGGLLER